MGEKFIFYKIGLKKGFFSGLIFVIIFPFAFSGARAAQGKLSADLNVVYNSHDNVDAIDKDQIDPTEMTWMDYLINIDTSAKLSNSLSLGIIGKAGYSQYLTVEGAKEEAYDVEPNEYDYFRAFLTGYIEYRMKRLSLRLEDTVARTRSLQDIYGNQISELSTRYLYTGNTASITLRLSANPRTRILAGYAYETIIFDEPEIEPLVPPPDSIEHRGLARIEYDISRRITVFADVNGGQRYFENQEIELDNKKIVDMIYADYTFYDAVIGLTYRFTENTSISAHAGADSKQFTDIGPYEIQDYTTPLIRVELTTARPQRYQVILRADTGTNYYGPNLFFDYYGANLTLRYYFTKAIYTDLSGVYHYDIFDLERNNREELWTDDRIDVIYIYTGAMHFDFIKRRDHYWLGFEFGYSHKTRDSNIDGSEDYVVGYKGVPMSYDTDVNYYFANFIFSPEIRFRAK